MSKTISARIDDTMHTMITDEANQEGITVNEKLKGMLNNHFNEEGKKEIFQSQNETLEQEILENCKEQKNKMDKISEMLPKLMDLISQTETKILHEVNQRFNDHLHNHADKKWHSSLKCNSC